MRTPFFLLMGLPLWAYATEPLVDVAEYIPAATIELRYAQKDNFLGRALYPPGSRCLLRESVAKRLTRVAESLAKEGLRLKLWDCYRPLSVQKAMWKIFPKPGFVANPQKGSHHNRGAAVDLTLTDTEGVELEMPTPFDEFSPMAYQGATEGISKAAAHNRDKLKAAMESEGFIAHRKEWWHFAARDAWRFEVLDITPVRHAQSLGP
ncbi:MAG: M15 family metallopeptidase [Cystobacterineae bacterium]|nr:M15 family metallopeptidase [Cystobacterineae bacterium]